MAAASGASGPKLELRRNVPVKDGLRKIVHAGLDHLQRNRTAAMQAQDPEAIHQMRVAIRHLRSALVLFDRYIEPDAAARVNTELRRLGRVLGAARDWDVFVDETIPEIMIEVGPVADHMRSTAETRRRMAHARVQREIRGRAYVDFIAGLRAWTDGDLWPSEECTRLVTKNAPLVKRAPKMMERLDKKARERAQDARRGMSTTKLHALRKTLKKLRYSTEFIGPLFDRKSFERYRKACKTLQEVLGALNDGGVARDLARRLAAKGRPNPGKPAVTQWAARKRQRALEIFPSLWDGFRETPKFWE